MERPTFSRWLFRALLITGALIAVALLVQTVINYLYVSENLIRQEARRTAEQRVQGLERSIRLARLEDVAGYEAVLGDFRDDFADLIASILLITNDGTVLASSGAAMRPMAQEERRRFLNQRSAPLTREDLDGQEIFVGVFVCRCALSRSAVSDRPSPPDRLLVQMAIYRDSLSAPFARLRRNAAVGVTAALALFVALGLIAARFGPYVRGKQLEREVMVAQEVQRALLASVGAWPAGVDAAAVCEPASQVGGDFFDIQEQANQEVAFSLGDVSGHGMSAALLMSMVHGAINSGSPGEADSPERRVAQLNRLLVKKSTGERFASLIWCVYDPKSGRLRYVNAGHPPGLVTREGQHPRQVMRLADGGPVLGVLPDAAYQVGLIEAREGDLLVLYSDGIVETTNGRDEYYGEGRLLAVIEEHRQLPAAEICSAILRSVNAFSEQRAAADDRTVLAVRLWRTA